MHQIGARDFRTHALSSSVVVRAVVHPFGCAGGPFSPPLASVSPSVAVDRRSVARTRFAVHHRSRTCSHARSRAQIRLRVSSMDEVLRFILELYRAAGETPVTEFHDLALKMLRAVVAFRSATWSSAKYEAGRLEFLKVHAYNEPQEMLDQFAALNRKQPVAVSLAARTPGVARILHVPSLLSGDDDKEMRRYVIRYGHEHSLIISDAEKDSPRSWGEWLSLYRPEISGSFTANDSRLVSLLMPHLSEALKINQSLALGARSRGESGAEDQVHRDGNWTGKALVRSNGIVLHCTQGFARLLADECTDWTGVRLPAALLRNVLRGNPSWTANRTVEIRASSFGEAMLLTARRMPVTRRLSPREQVIARSFGSGLSHKEVARQLRLSPVTVRNVVQNIYRKLGITDKAQLARIMALDSPPFQGFRSEEVRGL